MEKYPYLEWALITQNGLIQLFLSNERSLQWPIYTQLKQLRKEKLKQFWAWMEIEPMTSAIPVQCSTNWTIKPNGNWSHCEMVMGLIPVQALNFFRFLFVMPCLKKDKTGTSLSCLYIFFVVTGLNFFQVLFSTTSSVVFLAVRIY